MTKKDHQLKKATIVARCTENEKKQILKQAKKSDKSDSRYVLDCAIAGTERRKDKVKQITTMCIEMQEQINQLSYIVMDKDKSIDENVARLLLDRIRMMEEIVKCQC